MGYTMIFYVDGGCRNNGYSNAIAAASAVQILQHGSHRAWTKKIYHRPTNQRAEIQAIITALQQALAAYSKLAFSPYLSLKIYSDSRYAVRCLTEWVQKWTMNGWRTCKGEEVKNRDLIQLASELDEQVKGFGEVRYEYIPRERNWLADGYCNDVMDEMQSEESEDDYW